MRCHDPKQDALREANRALHDSEEARTWRERNGDRVIVWLIAIPCLCAWAFFAWRAGL